MSIFLEMLPILSPRRLALAFACAFAAPLTSTAQDLPASILNAAGCAPVPLAAPSDAPRIVGGRDTVAKALYGTRDLVVIDAGNKREIQVGQRFYSRRGMKSSNGRPLPAQDTSGWLTVVAVTDETAIALIDVACGGVAIGDHVVPYASPNLPPGVDRTESGGELDFTVMAHVVHGDRGRSIGGAGDFMIADIGGKQGIAPGARFGIFRDVYGPKQPLVAFGEAVVIDVSPDQAVLRLTESRDAVMAGDMLVRRKPVPVTAEVSAPSVPAQPEPAASKETASSAPAAEQTAALRSDYTFEDVHFDFDRFSLRPEALKILEDAVTALQRDPTLQLVIEGHSCSIGTAEYNLALGTRRAEAVREHLINRGIAPARLTTVSYGEEHPKHDNAKEETRRLNRRAALVVNLQP